jgi:hypothetical protein
MKEPEDECQELLVTHEIIREIYALAEDQEHPCFLWELFSQPESKYYNLVFPDPPAGPQDAYIALEHAYNNLLTDVEADRLKAEKLAASMVRYWIK